MEWVKLRDRKPGDIKNNLQRIKDFMRAKAWRVRGGQWYILKESQRSCKEVTNESRGY